MVTAHISSLRLARGAVRTRYLTGEGISILERSKPGARLPFDLSSLLAEIRGSVGSVKSISHHRFDRSLTQSAQSNPSVIIFLVKARLSRLSQIHYLVMFLGKLSLFT